MSVYKPKNSRFYQYDFVCKGTRFHGSTGAETLRKAQAFESAKREAVSLAFARAAPGETPKFDVRMAPSLDVAAQEWWEAKGQYLGKPDDPKDVQARETRLAAAVALVGAHKLVTDIETDDIATAMQRRRGKLVRGPAGSWKVPSNCTVNREVIDVIRPVIKRALKLAKKPPTSIDWGEVRMPEPKPKRKHFTDAQLDQFDADLPLWWHDFANFERRYGLRVSEMFFSLDDIDVPGLRVTLQDRKGDDDHILPILAEDMAMLAARKGRAQAAGLPHVWFRELKTGRLVALKRGGAVQAMRTAMRRSGLHASKGTRGSHALRHHAAMTYLRATKDLRGTQRLLGHASIQSTLTYAHAMEDTLREGLETALKSRNSPEPTEVASENMDIKQSTKG